MLDGKVALITGSTAGIGLAMAKSLAGKGASIMLNGFGTPDEIARLREEVAGSSGSRVVHNGADVSRPDEAAMLVDSATREFGRVDILINNAGTTYKAPIEECPPEKWDLVLALNLSASFHTIRTVMPQMRQRNWGRIINISSAYGLVGGTNRVSYVASKHGLVGLTKAVALETATTGITCNAICPGDVSTRIFYKSAKDLANLEGITREEAQARIAAVNMPSGRPVAPEQIAELAAFLCSDAAAQVRGSAFSIDGAWTAR